MIKILISSLAIIFLGCNLNKENTSTTENNKPTPRFDTQKEINLRIKEYILRSDSVILISHIGNDSDTGRLATLPEIVLSNRINSKIIKERRLITGSAMDSTIDILLLPTDQDSAINTACFDPHHSIVIFKNNQISYIDMCFHCLGLRTSKDLEELNGYEVAKWEKMILLFKHFGFKHEMPVD